MSDDGRVWQVVLDGLPRDRRRLLADAKALVDTPYLPGAAVVRNLATGETWARTRLVTQHSSIWSRMPTAPSPALDPEQGYVRRGGAGEDA